MTKALEAEKAHKRRERIIRLKYKGTFDFLELARELHEVEENKDWEVLGFDSMRAYMSAPEMSGGLDLTRSWLTEFKLNYEKFILELGRAPDQIGRLEPSKLSAIRTIATKENVDSWLNKAENLSLSDLRLEVLETKGIKNEQWLRVFDVWNFSRIDPRFGMDYPGRIPYEIIANTLYYFTDEQDIIVDPMAGGGTTIDVCKMMNRKCLAYDIKPCREDIKKHNLLEGWPQETQKANLIFWDPPYFKKKVEDYGEESISAFSKVTYMTNFKKMIESMPKTKVAFLMSNYIDYTDPKESIFTADYYSLFIKAGFQPLYEIQCPLSTQQYQAFDVERAKKEKQLLIISRTLNIYG